MRNRSCLFYTIFLLLLSVPTLLYAASVQLGWQANPEPDLESYNVYYGTESRSYGPPIPVDNGTTGYTLSGLEEGATYFFAVSAVDTSGNESGYSEEVSKIIPFGDNPYRLLWSPNDRSTPTDLENASISGDGYIFLAPETSVVQVDYSIDGQFHNTERYAPFDIGTPVHTTNMTDGTHVISTRVTLENGSTLDFDTTCTVANVQAPTPDTTAPQISITAPSSRDSYTSQASTIDLAGNAGDDQGLQQITWTSSNGASGAATGTDSWAAAGIQLSEGQNVITVTAMDAAGNRASDSITVAYTPPDTQAPMVSITSPNVSSDETLQTTYGSIAISGTAQDDRGIDEVSWSSGNASGVADGTTTWVIPAVTLSEGLNTFTVKAEDAAGNVGSKELRVEYTVPDTTTPMVTITSPNSSGTYTSDDNTINLAGTASDDSGLAQIAWVSSAGQDGTASGTDSWTISDIQLTEGQNHITITASDVAGNTATDNIIVTYLGSDTLAPTVAITTPTDSGTFTTESAIVDLAGTAGDNRGIERVAWIDSNGLSGIASGTTSWSIPGINLAEGDNIITVTATDFAGNEASAKLAIRHEAADTTAPVVDIMSPTTKHRYFSRTTTVSIAGNAADEAGITKVTWRNSRGESGICSGTSSWQASGIPLDRWWNTITVTAIDEAGNQGEQSLVVFRWK